MIVDIDQNGETPMGMRWLRDRRVHWVLLGGLALAFTVAHVAALFSESINWDELILLNRASRAVSSGVLDGGGRPGLGIATLVPFASECHDHVGVVLAARIVWAVITLAGLAGFYAFLVRAVRGDHATYAAATGLACLALVPIFERWSLQVRSDQPAIACALWGGFLLLGTRARPRVAALAGLLFGVGYLFSQKAVYVVGLGGLVAVGHQYIDRDFVLRRELVRAGGVVLGAAVAISVYKVVIAQFFEPVHGTGVDRELGQFAFYRMVLRFRIYRSLVTALLPQLGLLVLIFAAAVHAIRRDTPMRRQLVVALGVLLLGACVARFHAASFPYFWMTVGLFPSTAIALGWGGIREIAPRLAIPLTVGAWSLLIALGITGRTETLVDTQATQRAAYELIDTLPVAARGFHPEGGLFCRRDPDPFPTYLNIGIQNRFGSAEGARNIDEFIAEFRKRPVSFILGSHRLAAFPPQITAFWADHYTSYADNVLLAGWTLTRPRTIDVIVPGAYRWWPAAGQPLVIDGASVQGTITLSVGPHTVSPGPGGVLALSTSVAPSVTRAGFYTGESILEMSGARRNWW